MHLKLTLDYQIEDENIETIYGHSEEDPTELAKLFVDYISLFESEKITLESVEIIHNNEVGQLC